MMGGVTSAAVVTAMEEVTGRQLGSDEHFLGDWGATRGCKPDRYSSQSVELGGDR